MSQRTAIGFLLFVAFACAMSGARAQVGAAKPGTPLTCHKEVCALPTSSCQVLESNDCVHGGGSPRCPAIINVADGTSCDDGNRCTSNDVCASGVCGGTAATCSSPTDLCTPSTGCATPCGPAGCTVSAANGYLNPTLTVPAGALSANVAISMTDQGGDPNNAAVFHVYQFSPPGTTFATPATVNLPAPPLSAGQAAVIEVSDNGTSWTAIATTSSNGRVSGPIAHFSFCRTRVYVPEAQAPAGLIVTDMVDYQDLAQVRTGGLVIPPAGEPVSTCYSGDLYGLCFRMKNQGTAPITSTCPDPTPNPPPAGCVQMHVIPWQCYNASRNFPASFDPATMIDPATGQTTYEGQHCDLSNGGLLIPCADSVYNMDKLLPAGGLLPGQEIWVDMNFFHNSPPPANGVFPYACFGSSFVGVDLLFREPTCKPDGTQCDWQAGVRSAKDGAFIEVPNGTHVWPGAGEIGCTPLPGQTTCNFTCTAATCQAKWDWLVNGDVKAGGHSAQYPTLKCQRGSTPIDCKLFQPGDLVIKNWMNDARF